MLSPVFHDKLPGQATIARVCRHGRVEVLSSLFYLLETNPFFIQETKSGHARAEYRAAAPLLADAPLTYARSSAYTCMKARFAVSAFIEGESDEHARELVRQAYLSCFVNLAHWCDDLWDSCLRSCAWSEYWGLPTKRRLKERKTMITTNRPTE